MRDPARIDPILERLRAYWTANPDLRLGQIVLNALRDRRGAVNKDNAFNAEDDKFLDGLDAMSEAAARGKEQG